MQDSAPHITPDPDRDGVILHLPEITYLDSQVWAVDIGLTTSGLDALRAALAETPAVGKQSAAEEAAPAWPVFTLQRWHWSADAWTTHATYGPDARGEGNAYFAVSSERASQTGPIRLLKDGIPVLADDPATHYGA